MFQQKFHSRHLSGLLLFLLVSCNEVVTEKSFFELIPVRFAKESTKVSLINLEGNVVLEDEFSAESEILVTSGIITEFLKKGGVKYWSIDGKKVKPIGNEKYPSGTPFFEGHAIVRYDNGMLVLIDAEGREVIPNLSKLKNETIVRAGVPSEGLIRVKNDEGLWGYIDLTGELKIGMQFIACENFYEGMARAIRDNGKFVVIDKSGKELFQGTEGFRFMPITENCMGFMQEGSSTTYWGFMDINGNKFIKDNKFKEVGPFFRGRAPAKRDNEWGVIEKSGEYVGDLRTKYTNIPLLSSDGNIIINDDRKTKIYNKKGKLITSLDEFEAIIPVGYQRYLARQKNRKFMLIDEDGNELTQEPFYVELDRLKLGYLWTKGSLLSLEGVISNIFSLESSFIDFDYLFKTVFLNVTSSGIMGLTSGSTIEEVIASVPNSSAAGPATRTRRIDRSDDYAYIMGQQKTKTTAQKDNALSMQRQRGDFAEEEKSITPDENKIEETDKADAPVDPYPFISNRNNYYAPSPKVAGGLGYTIRFTFDKKLKTVVREDDPERPRRKIIVGYDLNREAKLRMVMIKFNFSGTDRNAFWKEFEKKLALAGWNTSRKNSYTNGENNNELRIRGNNLQYTFRDTDPSGEE